MLWSVFTALILCWIWCRVKNRRFFELSKQIKTGFTEWPLIGHAYLLFGNGVARMKGVQKMGMDSIKQGGLSYIWLGGYYLAVVTDPVDIDMLAKTCLDKGEMLDFMKELFGNGSIFAPVSLWRRRRKFLAPIFSVKNLNRFVDVFARKSSIMVDRLRSEAGQGAFGFWHYITTYSMDTVCETTIGVPIDTQSQEHQPFLKSFEVCTDLGTERLSVPWLRPDFIYKKLKRYQTFLVCKKIMYDFIHKVIASKRNILKNKEAKSTFKENEDAYREDYKSVLEMMMASEEKYGFTDIELREETMVMVLAGTDTSAVGVAYTCILLSRHPGVQEKVFEELQDVFGNSDRPVTAGDLPRLKYLEAVVKESLRFHPPIPAIVREVTQDVTLPSGPTLVYGTVIVFHIWGAHRNHRYWGEDANEFRPERFLEDTPRHPAAFIPFSHGHRNCLGYQYAMMSMKTAVATLVRHYRILPAVAADSNGDFPPLIIEYNVVMKDTEQFKLKLEPRTNYCEE